MMARNVHSPESCIREFIKSEFINSKDYTRQKCEWSLHRTKRALETGGFDASPHRIDASAITYLMDIVWRGYTVSYRKSELSYLKRYLAFYNNDVVRSMKIVFPQDMRVNVDWLEDDEYETLMTCPKTPLEEIVIHLELCLGFRSVEVARVKVSDIHYKGSKPYINVRGKGRGDGKYRSVRFHYLTKEVLDRWMIERREMVDRVRAYNPGWKDPGNLVIWCHYKHRPQAGAYGEHTGALDEMTIEPLRERLGFHFTNHTLRRSFGRRLFRAKVPVETISKFLGHESTSETLNYIGVNLDDMDEGMSMLAQYDREKGVL